MTATAPVASVAPALETPSSEGLPRLMYLGDVPVAPTTAGAVQLHRLFDSCPPEKLLVVGNGLGLPAEEHRLPGVRYADSGAKASRLLRSRFRKAWIYWLIANAPARAKPFVRMAREFGAEAVVTVADGASWRIAAALAKRLGLPLHLLVHDDWPQYTSVPERLRGRADAMFGKACRESASLLCVTSNMVEEYEKRYGARGEVLPPARGAGSVAFAEPPERLGGGKLASPVGAFAGSVQHHDDIRALDLLAEALEAVGGRLVAYSNLTPETARERGFSRPNVDLRPFVPPDELARRLREEADFLFAPRWMPGAEKSMRSDLFFLPAIDLNVLSKLVDYTAVGLPLLLLARPASSGARWVRENPGAAVLLETDAPEAIREAVRRLAEDGEHRLSLAREAIEVGNRDFSREAAFAAFARALARRRR